MSAGMASLRTGLRALGHAAIVVGMGIGLAFLTAPLLDPSGRTTDSPLPYAALAFGLAAIGLVTARWSRRQ